MVSQRKTLVSIGLNPTDVEILKKYANEQERSFSEIMRKIVQKFVKDLDKRGQIVEI